MECAAIRFYAVAHVGEAVPGACSLFDRETFAIVPNMQAHLIASLL